MAQTDSTSPHPLSPGIPGERARVRGPAAEEDSVHRLSRARIPRDLLAIARDIRHEPAPAEQKLWRCLRNRRLNGLKFRRQHPIGPFIADFYCADLRPIIELDGDSHADQLQYDAERTQWL